MTWEEVLESAAKPRAPLPGKVDGKSDSEATPESGPCPWALPRGGLRGKDTAPGLPGCGQRRGKARGPEGREEQW